MVHLARDTHGGRQVTGADQDGVQAGHGRDLLDVLDALGTLHLDGHQ